MLSAALLRRATLSLYRAQLRTARLYDANPALKPLTGLRGLRPDAELLARGGGGGGGGGNGNGGGDGAWATRVARAAEQFRAAFLRFGDESLGVGGGFGGGGGGGGGSDDNDGAAAPPRYVPSRSLADFVRLAYRQTARGVVAPASAAGLDLEALSEGVDDNAGGEGAGARAFASAEEVALDAAFALQRQLKQGADLFAVLGSDDGGGGAAGARTALPDLAALVPGEVREAPSLAPGVILVEHPTGSSSGGAGAGHCAVVVVYDVSRNVRELHGDEAWTVRGYVVNRPFPRSVADVLGPRGGAGGADAGALGAFGRLTLFHGGMDVAAEGRLSVLHRFGELEGAAPVNEEAGCPLFVGGSVPAINALLDSGRARPEDFKVLLGGWSSPLAVTAPLPPPLGGSGGGGGGGGGAGEAEGELSWPDAPAWLLGEGEGAAELAMLPAQFDTQGRFRDGAGLAAEGPAVEGYNYARFWHQNAAWARAVRGIGGSARAAAEAAGDEAGAARGAEIEAWARLHAAVVGYARAVGRESVPARFAELFAAEAGEQGGGGGGGGEGGGGGGGGEEVKAERPRNE